MIFGNPGLFAIHMDFVSDWNGEVLTNGVFDIYLNWKRIGDSTASHEVLSTESNSLLHYLNANPIPHPLPDAMKNMEPLEILNIFIEISYPKNAEDENAYNCQDFVISSDSLADKGFYIFRYLKENQEVILGGSVKQSFATSTTVPIGYLLHIAKEAKNFCMDTALLHK